MWIVAAYANGSVPDGWFVCTGMIWADVPPPIGSTPNTFRSCFLPGTPLNQLSKLGTEPDESNVAVAQELSLAGAAGLWRLAEEAFSLLIRMQEGGLTHGDAHLHNFIVCLSPLEVVAHRLQCALGRQRGPLARESMASIALLVRPADTFYGVIAERTFHAMIT